ncbi:MAG: ATP synthase F1 subunit delta [Candidatus Omnitrophica bacterium]|nr:ATP synthase F1 subunit delta [Candidatus Omnitrophota bacterium]
MADRALARRWAEAFVNALEASRKVQAGLDGLRWMAEVYQAHSDLRRFLGSPAIGQEEKFSLLARLFGEPAGAEGMALLNLLLRWDRLELLPAIGEEAVALHEERQGLLRGRITTAHPLSSSQVELAAKALGGRLGKRVVLERSVDPGLLGGLRVVLGSTQMDGSLAAVLQEVREQLLAAKV